MKKWTQGWLVYGPKMPCGNLEFVKKVSFQGFDKESVILQNAIVELKKGITGMLSVQTEFTFEEQLTTGIQITICEEIPAEGYAIGEVSYIQERTLYSLTGNMIVWLSATFIAFSVILAFIENKKRDKK